MMSHSACRFAAYLLAFIGLGIARWIHHNFDNPTIEQIVYHLRFNEGLATADGGSFLITFLVEALGLPALVAGLAVLTESTLRTHVRAYVPTGWAGRCVRRSWQALPLLLVLFSAQSVSATLSVPVFVRSLLGSDFFSAHYVPPKDVQLKPRALKNLVLIYVESLDAAYGDESLFGRNLLRSLHDVDGAAFEAYEAGPGAGWTTAGMVATQCGIPLKTMSVFDFGKASEGVTSFLPGAVCLGDVLQSLGYRNVFMGGAWLGFGGKGQFLADHGYVERYGRREWFKLGAGFANSNDWGLYDDELFKRAKSKLLELHRSGNRFNLTLLTLDTHHPVGFYSPHCKGQGAKDFAGIVECTAVLVADFVHFAKDNGVLDNTRIVIIGDHPAMPNPLYKKLTSAERRLIFNKFIPAPAAAKATEHLLSYDMFPTILQSIGVEVGGGRLGLGYAGFQQADLPQRTDAELLRLLSEVSNPSQRYTELWQPRR